jgi:hypothetical protein
MEDIKGGLVVLDGTRALVSPSRKYIALRRDNGLYKFDITFDKEKP